MLIYFLLNIEEMYNRDEIFCIGNDMNIKEELKREKEIREIEILEEERQRKVSQEDFSTRALKTVIYYVRWFLSIMFFIASFTFFGEEDMLLKMAIGLILAAVINPIIGRSFKNSIK